MYSTPLLLHINLQLLNTITHAVRLGDAELQTEPCQHSCKFGSLGFISLCVLQ